MTVATTTTATDMPVTVHGFVTDPKLVGYQILTNYESTYWAPLVSTEAWRLYEILRSFCHQGNKSCHPSINLLLAILGIKDRSVLIGRAKPKIVQGKEYRYPGLIQTLQDHNLVVAEVEGEGPKMHYTFHVNMTPGLLTSNQLSQLPELLQKKHAELLERCEEQQRQFEAKKRPPKLLPESPADVPQTKTDKGIGNSNTPLGNSNTPSWNFQYKQQPINNTHITHARARNDNNNSSDEIEPKNVVVVALLNQDISEKVAQRLAHRYSHARIAEKIEYLAFLQKEAPERVKNPRGWLRRAIEENYGPPDGFVSKADRERQAKEEKERAQAETEQEQINAQARQAFQKRKKAAKEARQQALYEQYGTTEEARAFWQRAQYEIKYTTPAHIAELATEMEILKIEEDAVMIGVERPDVWQQLQHPGTKKTIVQVLGQVAGRPVTLTVERIGSVQSKPT